MTDSSPPPWSPLRAGAAPRRLAGLLLLAVVFVILEPVAGWVTAGALATAAAAAGLMLSVLLWCFVLTRVSARWLAGALGRPRVLGGALLRWAILEIGRAYASSPAMVIFLGLLIGLCEGVVWPALVVRLFGRAKTMFPRSPGGAL